MRWGRTLLIIVIGLVALIVVALALAPALLNLEQIKERVVNRVEQQLHRNVELGQMRLEFFSGLGAGLDKLTIANPKGWQSPYFVKVDTLSIKVALLPLLSRKIEVSKIILNTGDIVVERDAQGRFNYDDLTAASATTTDTNAPAKPPPPGTISNLSITWPLRGKPSPRRHGKSILTPTTSASTRRSSLA
jgi:AsmA protein